MKCVYNCILILLLGAFLTESRQKALAEVCNLDTFVQQNLFCIFFGKCVQLVCVFSTTLKKQIPLYFTSISIISFSSLIDSKHYFENKNNCIFKFLFHCFRKLGFQQIFHYHPTSLYHMQVQCFCPFFVSCFNKYMILTTLYLFFSAFFCFFYHSW